MYKKEDYMRYVIFSVDSGQLLSEKLNQIPGYQLIELPYNPMRSEEGRKFYLSPGNGVKIHIFLKSGSRYAKTSNVLPQDNLDLPVLLQDDEIVKLARCAKTVDGLSVEVVASDYDLRCHDHNP